MAFLELHGLSKSFGGTVAVDDLSLSIAKGEFVSLLGPSGCGKTTTLQMIAGFVPPSGGAIHLDGKDLTGLKPCRRGLGIVFQSYALFPHMSVTQNVAFGLEMRKVPPAQRRERVASALEAVNLSGHADRYPRELSGGQRQRVALARALVIQPPVLLLDEPMGALDAKLREGMQIELRALQRRLGITTIMVTHDQAEAMTMADRIVLMNKGRIEQVGPPYAMYERPNGRFVSTFLGKANVLYGRVSRGVFRIDAVSLPVRHEAPDGDFDYMVRPERIRLVSTHALFTGHVRARSFQGNHWMYVLETPIGSLQVAQVNAGVVMPEEGAQVGVCWSAEDVCLLPRHGS